MKKKKIKYKDINIDIENKPKKSLEVIKKVKDIYGEKIFTSPDISYIIIKLKNHQNFTSSFSIYKKDNFEFIQKIIKANDYNCLPLNENSIILSGGNTFCEIWNKDKNFFSKIKSINTSINSNIIFNSKSHLFYFSNHNFNENKSSLLIWKTKNKLPISLCLKVSINYSRAKQIFFMNNEKILVVYHCPDDYYNFSCHDDKLSISFYDSKLMKIIEKLELDNKYCDLKPIKLDENRIIIIEKLSENCSYDENIEEKIKIMKVPEFEIVKEIEPEFPCDDVLVHRNYFIFYESMIKIYNSNNYQFVKEINIRGIHSMTNYKDNNILALVYQYVEDSSDFEKKKIKDLILYKLNI